MATDLFNNTSNNFIQPTLKPCTTGDSNNDYFQFLNGPKAGVVNNANILAFLDLYDIKIDVNSYNKETKILQPGEILFINGLTKQLLNKTQYYLIPNFTEQTNINSYFMSIDLSINVHRNFNIEYLNIEASSNYDASLSIDTALTQQFELNNIPISCSIDSSLLTFTSSIEGYDYNVTQSSLTLIDASQNSNSPFIPFIVNGIRYDRIYDLIHDASSDIDAALYPNTASRAFVIKANYNTTNEYDKWLYFNHIKDSLKVYTPINVETDISVNVISTLTFDGSVSIKDKPTIDFTNAIDGSGNTISNINIDASKLTNFIIDDSSIVNSNIGESAMHRVNLNDSSIYNAIYYDSSSYINGSLHNSLINPFIMVVNPSTNEKIYVIDDNSLTSYNGRIVISNVEIWDSSIANCNIVDCSIYRSVIYDSSINGSTLYNSSLVRSNGSNNNELYTSKLDSSVSYETTSSLYYDMNVKKVNSTYYGCSSTGVMGMDEYLKYVNDNDMWWKFGDFYMICSAIDDVEIGTKNLLNGVFVYNPQNFAVKIEYMNLI